MKEIEVKILEIDVAAVKQKLESWGAIKVFEGDITASYYDFSDRELRDKDLVLRLRKKGQTIELTLKEKLNQEEAKIMEEYEVNVTDFETMQKILYQVGLREVKVAKKYRVSYILDEVHFELDTFPDTPTFLEIEAPTLELVQKYVRRLGFSMQEAKPWSGGDLLRYYQKRKK